MCNCTDPVIAAWTRERDALERLALKYSIKAAETRLRRPDDPMADAYRKLSETRQAAARRANERITERAI